MVRTDLDMFICDDFEFGYVHRTDINTFYINVGVVYRLPDKDMAMFNINYSKLLYKLAKEKQKCYIAGDFNINFHNYESHVETEYFLNNIFSYFQYPTITRPTRFCFTTSTLIDNNVVNTINDYYSGLLVSGLSDHFQVFFI